ncbi:hypothetical protein OESDEN_16623 [Oesophagostomum dentatum]|uniref:Uncharacterized protein n=1 Tax=Oesophagostomum dentatum TaxID=61180 RepID=A0A0B1SII1_OESDE|nr:hypothetical protein OESDEN_16623 [Oesophagostomum dentatum]
MGKPYIYIYLIIAWATGIIQSLSVSLLATNRLSAILLPRHFNVMWYGSRLKLAIFIQVVPGFLVALLNLTNEVQFSENAKGGIVPEIVNKKVTTAYFLFGGLFLTANSIYLIIAYCYLFYKLRSRQKAQVSSFIPHKITSFKIYKFSSEVGFHFLSRYLLYQPKGAEGAGFIQGASVCYTRSDQIVD